MALLTEERWSNHPDLTLSWTYGQDLRRIAHTFGGVTSDYEYDAGVASHVVGRDFHFNEESGLKSRITDDSGSFGVWDEYGRHSDWHLDVGALSYAYALTYDDHDPITSSRVTHLARAYDHIYPDVADRD